MQRADVPADFGDSSRGSRRPLLHTTKSFQGASRQSKHDPSRERGYMGPSSNDANYAAQTPNQHPFSASTSSQPMSSFFPPQSHREAAPSPGQREVYGEPSRLRSKSAKESFDISDVGLAAGAPAPHGVSESRYAMATRSHQGPTWEEHRTASAFADAAEDYESRQEIVPWAYMDDRNEADGTPGSNHHPSTPPQRRHASGGATGYPGLFEDSDGLLTGPGAAVASSKDGGTPNSGRKKKNPFHFLRKKNSAVTVYHDREGSISNPSLGRLADQRKQSTVSLVSKYASHASQQASQMEKSRHPSSSTLNVANGNGSTNDVSTASTSARPRTRGGTELQAVGIDEEQAGADGRAKSGPYANGSDAEMRKGAASTVKEKRRRLVRPLTRDKDKGRNGSDDNNGTFASGHASTLAHSGVSDGATGRKKGHVGDSADWGKPAANKAAEVEMTLDTNFDHIDDIVDTSLRQATLPVGPMGESLTDGLWSSSPGLPTSEGQMAGPETTPRLGYARAPSDISAMAPASGQSQYAEGREDSSPLLWLQSPPPPRNGSYSSQPLQRQVSHNIDLSRPGLRKVSLAEIQRLASASLPQEGQRSTVTPGRGRAESASGKLDPGASAGLTSPVSEYEEYPFNLHTAPSQTIFDNVQDMRKDSAASKVSARSGVSPKSSAVNLRGDYAVTGLPSSEQATSSAFPAPSYHFPPNPALPIDLALRKSSTGSAGTNAAAALASTWMAPDSWAVQADKDLDGLRDEDNSSDEDRDDAESDGEMDSRDLATERDSPSDALRGRKTSAVSGGSGSHTLLHGPHSHSHSVSSSGGLQHSGLRPSSGPASRDTSLAVPRGSQVSSGSISPPDPPSAASTGDLKGSFEASALAAPTSSSANPSPSTPTMDRGSSSRVGALGVAGGAAVAAASMLGLRGKQKHGTSSSRPGTATQSSSASPVLPGAFGGYSVSRPATGDESIVSGHTDLSVSHGALVGPASSRSAVSGVKRGVLTHQSSQHGSIGSKNYILRIDTPFGVRTVSIPLHTTAAGLRAIIGRKSPNGARSYRLFVRDKGSERPLGDSEKPPLLQKRRMEQAGYTENDALETIGREDHSYLLRFVYRPDLVPTFDSEQFGSTEDNYTHLDLHSRNLEMVPIFLYRHADWINSLDLSGNPMSDIPSDFIQLCTNLRTLRLSDLALKRIPQSLRHSKALTHLDLSNNRIPDLNHITLDQIPQLKSLKLQNNRLTELPPSLAKLLSLKQLNVSNNRFDTFPPFVCELLSLTDLDISFNAIGVLPDQIAQLKSLESLILVGNSVERLPTCMEDLVSLRKIDLRRNLLQDVTSLFRIASLGEAQCEHNSIKSFSATLGANLRSINLGHNPLSKLSIGSFAAASQLVCLNLSAANLCKLDEVLLAQLPSLYDLILDNNQFVVLPDSIGDLRELRLLSCTNNHLAALPDSLGKLVNLRRLLVHNNNLSSLPKSIWHCQNLTSINASSNLLESFPLPELSDALIRTGDTRPSPASNYLLLDHGRKGSGASAVTASIPATPTTAIPPPKVTVTALGQTLKKLRLADNRLTDDVFGAIGLLTEVEILNLSFNDIYEVPSPSLSKLSLLRELYLSGNDLSSLPTDDLVQMRHLRILHLNANRLQTLPAELGQLRSLANLDVGNNSLKYNIANWHYDWNWNSNPELRYLNLSGNKRLEIKSKMSTITGAGRRMDTSDFQRLVSLRVLGLMDVTVTLQQMPDENDNRRVRTSLSQVNGMSYGISDALGRFDNLSLVDVVVPNFRKDSRECLIGLFEGRNHGAHAGSRVAKFLSDWVRHRVEKEVAEALGSTAAGQGGTDFGPLRSPDEAQVSHIMRRAFLRLQQEYAILLMSEGGRGTSETIAPSPLDDSKVGAHVSPTRTSKAHWQAGASGVLVYVVDRSLHVANAGDALAVLSRGGTAYHMTTRHEPFDREETLRIRSAEGWVSLRGYVNDSLDVSRSFGYYHLTPFVNAAPAVHSVQLNDSDEFVVIASRALWDHMSYQTAVDIARTERDDLMIAAQKLRDFAISYGAEESVMVMIVAVGDLFDSRRENGAFASSRYDPTVEAFKKTHRRDRDMLPSDRTLARLEREVAPPIGHVALVFTDIKNSTSLWETNGGMQSAMRLHNALLRRQLRVVGGYEVKTEGDAFMVSFPSVASAMIWCFNVQIQLVREDWPQEILESEDGKEVRDAEGNVIYRGLSVRMGIHWGWPVCENDPVTRRMDYFGPMVNRASRISGAADGGQIMVSRDVVSELTDLLGTFDEGAGPTGAQPNTAEVTLDDGEADLDEETFRLLHPNVTRDMVLLRRMGFGISEVGERKLKGLEIPEMLNLVYPKQLAGRLATREDADAPAPQVFEPTPSLLNIDEIKALGMICLRLESLSNSRFFPGVLSEMAANMLEGDAEDGRSEVATVRSTQQEDPQTVLQPAHSRARAVERYLALKPELLIISIRDDAPDDELATLLEQLVVRIRNALATITLRQCVAGVQPGPSGGASPSRPLDVQSLLQSLQGLL
ncbi:unnamed protein product [Parajaminaea phylloscopi]